MLSRILPSSLLRKLSSRKTTCSDRARRRIGVFETVESRVLLAADLALSISDADASSAPGETIAYTFGYSNIGDTDAAGITISTRVPRSTTFNAEASDEGWSCSEPQGRSATVSCSVDVGDVAVDASGSVAFGVTVDSELSSRTRSVTVSGRIADNGEAGRENSRRNNYASERTPIIQQLHDLQINLHDSRATVVPGGSILYTAGFANTGAVAATGASISMDLPENTTFNAEGSADGWTCTDGTCTFNVGDVDVGAEGATTISVDVGGDLSNDIRSIRARASIADDGAGVADANGRNNIDGAYTPVMHALPDLAISIDDGDLGTAAGGGISYSIDYSNQGTAAATGSVISMKVPAHTTFDPSSSTDGWTCDEEGACTFDLGTVSPEATGNAIFSVIVDADISTNVRGISARALISHDEANGRDITSRNNRAYERIAIQHALPDIVVELASSAQTVAPGGDIVYTLNYANHGPVNATGAKVSFHLPRGVVLNEAESSKGWTCENGRCTLEIGQLDAGATGTASIAVTVNAAAKRRLTAWASVSDDGENGRDGNRRNNFAFARTAIEDGVDNGEEA